ncbi:hypothetical protein LMH87_011320 [Akanthomyces muscarius]|uniref:Uncharacterized protein n=1 Tax=Akanthomyces muscarius TaxID=2231603 RepID=A0A9W8UKV3_AKAMU|nr:hypothetical protein LMH87_011320 [Akanthomyces muscarius]KAJ4150576.1 hypothetical protein LMH87_011320 [Akanthomyces muscarius]
MAPPLRITHPRKRANAARKAASRQHRSVQSTNIPDQEDSAGPSTPLWSQVRALEQANAALFLSNEELAFESAQQQRRIEDLDADNERQRTDFAADRSRRIKRASVTLGDLAKTLCAKRALQGRLDDAHAQLLALERKHEDERAAHRAEMRIVRAQLAHDKLESKIHRAAAQVAHRMFENPKDGRAMIDILKRCRLVFTGSEAPPPPRPASPEPHGAADPVGIVKTEQCRQPQQQELVYTPQRPTGQPLTPESLTGDQGSPMSYSYNTTPRREGLRPRTRRYVDPNGSPWNLRE